MHYARSLREGLGDILKDTPTAFRHEFSYFHLTQPVMETVKRVLRVRNCNELGTALNGSNGNLSLPPENVSLGELL